MVLMSRAWCDWRVWVVLAVCGVSQGAGSATVFRCGEVYTNQRVAGQGCEPVTGGQVSVIGAPKRAATKGVGVAKPAPLKGSKAQDPAQADKALAVLRAELAQAENRLAQAQAERASGSAAAEQAHSRAAADVQSLQREIARWSRP